MPELPAAASAKRADIHRWVRTFAVSYVLIGLGLLITLMAFALDEWTEQRGLELILAGLGLTTAILAALLVAYDSNPQRGGDWRRELACRCWKR